MNSARICRLSRGWAYWWGGLACLVVSGCFSGEYGRRMDQTVNKLKIQGEKAAAVFEASSPVNDANDAATGISLRLPVFVDSTAKAKTMQGDSENAQPPFCDLPGFAYAYEIPSDGGPAYIYFAAVKVDENPTETLMQEVKAAVGKTFTGAEWQDVSLETFSGGTTTVKRLNATGTQRFGTQKADGQFDLYLVSSANYSVLIGWRASLATAGTMGFFEKAAISMGTVQGNL